jgi:hypothetical protein
VIIKVMGISDLTTESASNEKNTKIPNLKNKEKTRPKATTEQFVNDDRSYNHKACPGTFNRNRSGIDYGPPTVTLPTDFIKAFE